MADEIPVATSQPKEPKPKKNQRLLRKRITKKAAKLVEGINKGKNQSQAAIDAGYSPKNAAQSANQALKRIRQTAPDAFEELGYTIKKVLKNKLIPLMDAEETKFFADKGIVMDNRQVAANDIRLRATVEVLDLIGAYDKPGDDSERNQVGGITINLAFMDPERKSAVAAILSARRSGNGQSVMDATVHEDAGRKEPG